MPVVQVSRNATPYYVDDFDGDCERSCEGALHFLPASTKVITKSELEHTQKAHKDFAKHLHVVPIDETNTRVAKKTVAETKKWPPKVERASQRPSQAQRRAAGQPNKTHSNEDITKPNLESTSLASTERKLSSDGGKFRDKKKASDK